MGLLTRFVRGIALDVMSVLSCSELELHPSDEPIPGDNSNNASSSGDNNNQGQENNNNNESVGRMAERGTLGRWVQLLSTLFDLLDTMNFVVDMIFVVHLFKLPDSTAYASLLLTGLILGRLVVFRATNIMFRGGIDWSPFWIDITYKSNKNKHAYALLYCLLFSETAVFLLEDYPSLVVYAHWPVINFPPDPLGELAKFNVALSAASLVILTALFLVAIVASLFLMKWKEWTWKEWCINGTKIALFLLGCALLARYVVDILITAFEIAFDINKKQVPSNKVLFIPLCQKQSFETRKELCDERIFVVMVVIAWGTAGIFIMYLLFKPATYAVKESFYVRSRTRFASLVARVRKSDAASPTNSNINTSSMDLTKSQNTKLWKNSSNLSSMDMTTKSQKNSKAWKSSSKISGGGLTESPGDGKANSPNRSPTSEALETFHEEVHEADTEEPTNSKEKIATISKQKRQEQKKEKHGDNQNSIKRVSSTKQHAQSNDKSPTKNASAISNRRIEKEDTSETGITTDSINKESSKQLSAKKKTKSKKLAKKSSQKQKEAKAAADYHDYDDEDRLLDEVA
ncbi:hypothetical protein ACA910_020255 [Epithemia clementina (nom. ined.)]